MKGGLTVGKKIKGRKRHITTDTMGNLLSVVVHAANIHDTKGGYYPALLAARKYPRIERFCADAGYRGTFVEEMDDLGLGVDIIERNRGADWKVLPKRWVVERTFAWLGHTRRLSKDYEITVPSAEAMIMISHSRTLLKRVATN